MKEKDLDYFKQNAEEDYMTTPISVLRYITELEQKIEELTKQEKTTRTMKQLTGVEWLETRAEEREKNNPNESAYWHLKQLQKDFDQAKEMEKEQIGDAWENGKKSTQCKTPMCERKTGIGYYNKTFKQEQ